MIPRISQIIAPPVFQGDEQQNRAGWFLNTILWTMLIGAILALPLVVISPAETTLVRLAAIFSVIVLSLVLLRIMHAGHVRLVSAIAVIGVWGITNLAILFGGGGVRSIGFPGNIIVVLIAGILLGRRAALGAAGLCIATGFAFVYARHAGLIPNLLIRDTDQEVLIVYSIHLAVSAVLLNLSLRNAEQALTQAHTEIGERRQAEAALQEAETLFRTLVEQTSIVVYRDAPDTLGSSLYISPQIETLLGYSAEEWLSEPSFWETLVHPQDLPRVLADVEDYISRKAQSSIEYRLRTKDGSWRWVRDETVVVKNEAGLAQFVHGVFLDITERKQIEADLRQRAEEMSLLYQISLALTSGQDLYHALRAFVKELKHVMTVDAFHIGLYDEHTDLFSYSLFLNLDEDLQLPPRSLRETPGLTWEVISSRRTLYLPDVSDPKTQETHDIVVMVDVGMRSYIGIPLMLHNRVIGVMSVQSRQPDAYTPDQVRLLETLAAQVAITIEKSNLLSELHRELSLRQKLIDELESKNAELERFTYTVSHDLKSPLVTITGFLGYLEKDVASGNAKRLKGDVKRIREAVTRMYRLLSELLELSRIGRLMNPSEIIPFEELVREALELTHGRLKARGVAVRILPMQGAQPSLPAVYGDRQRLLEVMQNLIDNAAKFMGDQVDPRVEIGQSSEQDGRPVFFVKDNGIGIAPEYQERIFGLFNKLDPNAEGTGIGLALVKRIVEIHGGRVWVRSDVGQGSTFYFTLPRE